MMMPNDASDFGVVVDLAEDSFANGRVLFHSTTFLERECSGLLQESGRQTDLSDVMDETAHVRQLLQFL
jgi:hypothetical protein